MPEKKSISCARPTGGVVGDPAHEKTDSAEPIEKKGEVFMIQVGKVWEEWKVSQTFE